MLHEALLSRLGAAGINAVCVDETDSTQNEAVALARAGAECGTVVIARTQSGGRGRMGRTWLSPAGGLYASVLFRPGSPLETWPSFTVRAGVAVVSALRDTGLCKAVLKWPNDCLVDGRKLCGMLAESFPAEGFLVVGIGMNVASVSELAGVRKMQGGYDAISLSELGVPDPAGTCCAVISRLISDIRAADDGSPLDTRAVDHILWSRGFVTTGAGTSAESGTVVGVDGLGRLMLGQPDGNVKIVSFGEVHDAGGN